MDLGLKDRVYIVTGGARGLGRATVDLLVAEGARVLLSGRSKEALEAAVADLGGSVIAQVGRQRRPGDGRPTGASGDRHLGPTSTAP